MKKGTAYLRKSTFGKDENGCERQEGSFDRQKLLVMDYAKQHGIEIVRWYEEPVSGKSIRKRSVFLQMMKDAESLSRPFEVIIFGEYDRFMRDVKEAMRYEVLLDDLGIEIHFTNLKNDGSPADEIYKSLARQMAADYSRDLARKVLQGMMRKAKLGSWLGGVAPYGYRKTKDANGCTWLVIYEPEAKVIRMIFDLSLKGAGHKRIAIDLNRQEIPSSEAARKRNSIHNKNPDGKWSGYTVRAILRNPVYKGVVRWNKRARVDCFDWKIQGQGTIEIGKLRTETACFRKNADRVVNRADLDFYIDRMKPVEEWIVIEAKAPQIVTSEVFDAVQERFRPYSSRKWRRINGTKYLMANALVCMDCGNRFFGHRYSKIIKTTGERVFHEFYRCSGDQKKGTHSSTTKNIMMKQEPINQIVINKILSRIQYLVRPERVKELLERKMIRFLGTKPDRLAQIEKELKTVTKEIDRMIQAYAKFETPLPEDKVNGLKSRQKALEAQRDGLVAAGHTTSAVNIKTEVDQFLERLQQAQTEIQLGSPQDRIRIREAFLVRGEVFWYNNRPEVQFLWRRLPKVAEGGYTAHLHSSTPPPYWGSFEGVQTGAIKKIAQKI
jgi:DNA invertase Pin-like site-specific DNA recombinase